jgi:hypothetical protein
VEDVDAPAVMAPEVSIARTASVSAEEEPREEHHRDDEHHAGDDADPRQHLKDSARSAVVLAADRRGIGCERGCGRMLGCLGHTSDDDEVTA